MPDSASKTPPRRSTLGLLLWGSLAVVAAPALYVAARFLRPPRSPLSFATAGNAAVIGAGTVKIIKVGITDAAVMRNGAGEIYALDLRCTHAGCNVLWRPGSDRFACPCHGGAFSREGEVIKGPPKAPLRRLDIRVEEGGGVVVSDGSMKDEV